MKVLLVDDSAPIRRFYAAALAAAGFEISGEAADPYEARDKIIADKPHVVVLDIEMPRMDGITFLRKLMRYYPMPVVVCSTLTTQGGERALEALHAGACDVLSKPTNDYPPAQMAADLVDAVHAAASSKRVAFAPSAALGEDARPPLGASACTGVIAIGASTGGTTAIETVLTGLPPNMPPIVITQHLPEYIVPAFAQRLDKMTPFDACVAVDGAQLREGVVYVAPGGQHLLVERRGESFYARLKDGPLVNGHRPSVDVLFRSLGRAAGKGALAVLLTGMGRDGAKGMTEMHDAGAHTLCQDEASCVVFGMPRVAIEIGAADEVVPLARMAARIVSATHPAVRWR